jgi:uncharacterized cupredoxin-like copper-binding protein
MNETEKVERDDASAPLLFGQGQAAWLAVVTVVAVLGLVLGFIAVVMASGDEGGGGGATADGPSDALTIAATEFAFDPPDATVAAGAEVPVTLQNEGGAAHNWTVLSEEIAAEGDFSDDLVLAEVPDIEPGESAEATLTIDEAGTYQIICTVPGHFDSGMVGSLTVQ